MSDENINIDDNIAFLSNSIDSSASVASKKVEDVLQLHKKALENICIIFKGKASALEAECYNIKTELRKREEENSILKEELEKEKKEKEEIKKLEQEIIKMKELESNYSKNDSIEEKARLINEIENLETENQNMKIQIKTLCKEFGFLKDIEKQNCNNSDLKKNLIISEKKSIKKLEEENEKIKHQLFSTLCIVLKYQMKRRGKLQTGIYCNVFFLILIEGAFLLNTNDIYKSCRDRCVKKKEICYAYIFIYFSLSGLDHYQSGFKSSKKNL
jgi:chromosome segregation ATPase